MAHSKSPIYLERYRARVGDLVSDRTATTYLGKLVEDDVLERHDRGRATRQEPARSSPDSRRRRSVFFAKARVSAAGRGSFYTGVTGVPAANCVYSAGDYKNSSKNGIRNGIRIGARPSLVDERADGDRS